MTTPAPNGCQHCGIPEREHARQWTDETGWHAYELPTDAQILARMKARRAQRATNQTETTTMSDLAQRLADTAAGTWGEEASAWLLDIQDHWIPELDRCGLIRQQPMAGGGTATTINWAINTNQTPLIGTQSEWQILRVAADLVGKPIDDWFAQDLTSLDEPNRRLVLHAIAWAAGGRAFADQLGLLAPDNPAFDLAEYRAAWLAAAPTD
ncbi:hypothetical protein BX265_4973 [Streptomyces sp. TLI_235]|nr:hypothetical protein [Streptomyces sp. TLI_235]PBC80137.1 hypothetical protein BX265_4973 [Streptomyces sp. TLI_235]